MIKVGGRVRIWSEGDRVERLCYCFRYRYYYNVGGFVF